MQREATEEAFVPYESINDALIECVRACGGSKSAGVALWPTKGVEAAQRHLLACLNPERNEKLSPNELMLLLRLARDKGCHVGMQQLSHELSYAQPAPIEPKDELAELLRQNLEAHRESQRRQDRIERLLQPAASLRSVA